MLGRPDAYELGRERETGKPPAKETRIKNEETKEPRYMGACDGGGISGRELGTHGREMKRGEAS